jgi:sterol desaturase/sphingolipid hydroxylase (fatty acid hydroxylase superfamily)
MTIFNALSEKLTSVLFAPGSNFSLFSLAFAFCVAAGFLAHRQWRRRGHVRPAALARAFFSRRVLFHRSTRADVGYFLLNVFVTGVLIGWACLTVGEMSQFVQSSLTDRFGARAPLAAPEFVLRAATTVIAFLAYEFGYWFDHYLKHRVTFLWEVHKTHHSAETLTPWTVWRVHPLDSLVFVNVLVLCVGSVVGVTSWAFGAHTPVYAIDGTNVLLVFFFFAYVHLQHSQVWIPFTGALGRLFMSPAHHQIHHSVDPAHYNRNMGSCLAIWDWMFGTLEVPSEQSPRLVFGVDNAGEDPHSVTQLLIAPVRNSLAALLPRPPEAPAQALGLQPQPAKPPIAR